MSRNDLPIAFRLCLILFLMLGGCYDWEVTTPDSGTDGDGDGDGDLTCYARVLEGPGIDCSCLIDGETGAIFEHEGEEDICWFTESQITAIVNEHCGWSM